MTARQFRGLIVVAAVLLASAAASSAPPVANIAAATLDERRALNPLSEISLESLTGFRDRPLFTPGRRPPPPPTVYEEPELEPVVEAAVEVAPEEPPEAPAVKLAGVLEIDSEVVAMLRDDENGTTLSVRLGDPLDAWTVSAIGADSVTLELDGQTHDIKIFQPGPLESAYPGSEPDWDDGMGRVRPMPEDLIRRADTNPDAMAPPDEQVFEDDELDEDFDEQAGVPLDAADEDADYLYDAADDEDFDDEDYGEDDE